MAMMPNFETIKKNYLTGLWNERMLKTAVTCKAITKDQYDEIVAAKAAAK